MFLFSKPIIQQLCNFLQNFMAQALSVFYMKLMTEFFHQFDPVHKWLEALTVGPGAPGGPWGGGRRRGEKWVGQINIFQLALVAVISLLELFLQIKSGKYLSFHTSGGCWSQTHAILLMGRSLLCLEHVCRQSTSCNIDSTSKMWTNAPDSGLLYSHMDTIAYR